jgi:hypothetical protein
VTNDLTVAVDWGKDGTFVGVGEVVTARIRGDITATYGRDQGTALNPVVAGRGTFTLDNISRDYSPRNASSPLFGKVKPSRPVLVTRTVGATTYTIFRGHTDSSSVNPDVESKTVDFSLVDSLADFAGVKVTTPLYQGLRTGDAIGKILDAVGWTGGRDIDSGSTIIPWWWEDGTDALDALKKVLASEGPPALLTVDVSGGIVFRDRQHRLIRSASTTSQVTMRGTDGAAEPRMGKGFTYDDGWEDVVNSVQFSVDERRPAGALSAVWSTEDPINIAASQSYVAVLQASDPFQGAVAPVAGTDFTLVSGGVASVTLSRTSGISTSITITATGAGASLTGLQLRAYSVPVARTYQVTATDSTSITDYGARGLPSGQDPVWASLYDAQAIANLLVLQRKQPLTQLQVRFVCQHTQTNRLAQILKLNLSDRVTVIEPETQVNGAFFVESITHTIADVTQHEVVFALEAVPALPTSVFVLGTSLLNGADPLGY